MEDIVIVTADDVAEIVGTITISVAPCHRHVIKTLTLQYHPRHSITMAVK